MPVNEPDPAPPERPESISDHFELLAVMGQDFAATLDIEDTLKRALERITGHMKAAGGALFLLDEAGLTLTCQACSGETEITGLTLNSDQGIVGRCVQGNAGEIVRDVENDPNFDKSVDQTTGFTTRSILCAPMSVKDQRIGAIELVNKLGGDGLFMDSDLQLLQALSSSAGLAILNARMAEALVEQERVRRELELAAEIQRSLLPERRADDFPVYGVNVPARMVSGDFYDFFELGDGRICFNLADVSGKGMNAALLMAKTASLFRCLGKEILDPGRLMARINGEICETASRGMFVTMVGGIYDPSSGVVRLANAGHEPPLFHDPEAGFTALPANAPPLGIPPLLAGEVGFEVEELRLNGGTLYIFTDGVTEGYLADGSELTSEGLMELMRQNKELPISRRVDAVIALIDHAGAALRDDITLLAIDDKGPMKIRMENGGAAREAEKESAASKSPGGDADRLLRLEFKSRPDRLKLVRAMVGETARACGSGENDVRDIIIAVDEACQNVIRHAYGDDPGGDIILEVVRYPGGIEFLLKDFAETVDPTKIKPRDLDDIRPGGLGVHFMREVMDEVEFLPLPREDKEAKDKEFVGGNLLRMLKRL